MTEQTVETLQKRVDTLETQVEKLTQERDDAKKAAAGARKQASAAKRALPAAPRKIGRIAKHLTVAELREKIAEGKDVELVFSDGRGELRGLEPRSITGEDAFVDTINGLKLNVPELMLHGPGAGTTGGAYSLAGYALFVDGDLVAYAERPTPLTIGTGSTFDLKDDVIFPVDPL